MPVDKIYFHIKFFHGSINTEKFRDLATFNINDTEDQIHLNRIADFTDRLLDGDHIIGKNVYNNGKGYESCRVGHYHSGDYTDTNYTTSHISQENLGGARSGSVIHYCWKGKANEIVILGYSPIKHDKPFPQISHKNNPLRSRIKIVYPRSELVDVASDEIET